MMNLSKFFVFVTMFILLLIAGYLGYQGGELQDFLRKRTRKPEMFNDVEWDWDIDDEFV